MGGGGECLQSMKAEVLIIGGGVIGVCAAYYLSAAGHGVTLIEKQGEICPVEASSYGNAGLIVPSHSIPLAAPGVLGQGLRWLLDADSPFYIRPRLDPELIRWLWRFRGACAEGPMRRAIPVLADLGRTSSHLLRELVTSEGLDCGYDEKGWLLIYQDRRAFDQAVEEAELLREFGIASEVLDGDGVRRKEPNVLPAVVGGVYFPEDAHLIPHRFVGELARRAASRGVRLQIGTEVLGFETAGRRVSAVVTTRGRFTPEQVVWAAGAWTPILARGLGLRLPIEAAKGYSVTVRRPAIAPGVPLYLGERKVAVTPMGPLVRLGGTLELAGLDLTVSRRRVEAILRAAREYLPGMAELELVELWRGLRPVTPDGLPLIGRSRRVENLIVACGHGMLGVTQGPVTGKLVAEIVAGTMPSVDLGPLRVERFG